MTRLTTHSLLIPILAGINIILLALAGFSLEAVDSPEKQLILIILLSFLMGWLIMLLNFKQITARLQARTFSFWQIRLVALFIFEIFLLFASQVDSISPYVGGIAFVNSMAALMLLQEHPAHPRYVIGIKGKWAKIFVALISIVIALAALVTSLWQFRFIHPLANNLHDPYLYYLSAFNILGENTVEGHTFIYPVIIALTSQIYNNMLPLILFQHLLRGMTAIIAFLILRRFHLPFSILVGILLAVSPVSANFAHIMLTEIIYLILLTLVVLFTLASIQNRLFLILTGCTCAMLAFTRGTGALIPVIIFVYLLAATQSLKKVLLFSLSFALFYGIFTFAYNQLLKERASIPYYYFPLIYYDLLEKDNGPVSESFFQQVIENENCAYKIPEHTSELETSWPVGLYVCAKAANMRDGIESELYLEGILAHPTQFMQGMAEQIFRFVTQSEVPSVYREADVANYPLIYTTGIFTDDPCLVEIENDYGFYDYICVDVQHKIPQDEPLLEWGEFYADFIMQPYRLQGEGLWLRFWTALAMVGFIVIKSPRLRLPVLLFAAIILYHAAAVAFAQWNIPRYVLVLDPVFVLITAAFWATMLIPWPPTTKQLESQDEEGGVITNQ